MFKTSPLVQRAVPVVSYSPVLHGDVVTFLRPCGKGNALVLVLPGDDPDWQLPLKGPSCGHLGYLGIDQGRMTFSAKKRSQMKMLFGATFAT